MPVEKKTKEILKIAKKSKGHGKVKDKKRKVVKKKCYIGKMRRKKEERGEKGKAS